MKNAIKNVTRIEFISFNNGSKQVFEVVSLNLYLHYKKLTHFCQVIANEN